MRLSWKMLSKSNKIDFQSEYCVVTLLKKNSGLSFIHSLGSSDPSLKMFWNWFRIRKNKEIHRNSRKSFSIVKQKKSYKCDENLKTFWKMHWWHLLIGVIDCYDIKNSMWDYYPNPIYRLTQIFTNLCENKKTKHTDNLFFCWLYSIKW